MRHRDTTGLALSITTSVALLIAQGMVFLYAPREATMGDVQRIFYFHVSSAWVGFFAFFVAMLGSIGYLVKGQRKWDRLALSSIEVGLAFMAAAVIMGSLWARPVWGTYWTWEPRLTISAVQLLVYLAYLMLRAAVENPEQGARFAAVYGVVAFVTVPVSWFAIRWWRSIHPDMLTSGGEMALTPRMSHTLAASLVALTLLYAAVLRQRMRLGRFADALASLRTYVEREGVDS
ncbi:MAG: cytochrome c biogenesis protein [Anaerolineae bacterium]|nr:cytochrome c biogenesis protein [Anaerolineae bacterium]